MIRRGRCERQSQSATPLPRAASTADRIDRTNALRKAITPPPAPSRGLGAPEASLPRVSRRAADVSAKIGSAPAEATARLRAGETHRALALFRSMNASAYIAEAQ